MCISIYVESSRIIICRPWKSLQKYARLIEQSVNEKKMIKKKKYWKLKNWKKLLGKGTTCARFAFTTFAAFILIYLLYCIFRFSYALPPPQGAISSVPQHRWPRQSDEERNHQPIGSVWGSGSGSAHWIRCGLSFVCPLINDFNIYKSSKAAGHQIASKACQSH